MNFNMINTITCNNAGASCIEAGDYSKAIVNFSRALKSSKASIDNNKQGEPESLPFKIDLDTFMMTHGKSDKDPKDGNESSSDFLVYKSPIRIPESLFQQEGFDSEEVLFSVIAIFNLALAHHLSGLESKVSSTNMLQKAVKLYEYGVQIQESHRSDECPCTLFFLSTLNNVGDIHRRLGDALTSERCFQQLLSILMFLGEYELASAPQFELFFKSTFFLVCPDQWNVAAAA
jgi:tetratricopeptide (TPR) repeat protein